MFSFCGQIHQLQKASCNKKNLKNSSNIDISSVVLFETVFLFLLIVLLFIFFTFLEFFRSLTSALFIIFTESCLLPKQVSKTHFCEFLHLIGMKINRCKTFLIA
jgi:hypothetical protein